ncbi:MAG TPA: hypothetical protein VLA72_14155, partial [Anaerolineales bacterium]|nr:hypothetical protein [Anaerolineales bacterium]
MFTVLALIWSVYPALALAKVREPENCPPIPTTARTTLSPLLWGIPFAFLLLTVFSASMTISVGRMGLSMVMNSQQFSASEVSTANAIGGLVTSTCLAFREFVLSVVVAFGFTIVTPTGTASTDGA